MCRIKGPSIWDWGNRKCSTGFGAVYDYWVQVRASLGQRVGLRIYGFGFRAGAQDLRFRCRADPCSWCWASLGSFSWGLEMILQQDLGPPPPPRKNDLTNKSKDPSIRRLR